MSNFYGRVIELLVNGQKITNEFTVKFSVPFDDGPAVNMAEVEIYNLLDTTINNFKEGSTATLNAGYIGDVGVLLVGRIKSVDTDWNGVDKITSILVADANDNWMTKEINKTYKKDVTARAILLDCIAASGLKTGKLNLPVSKVYKGGKTIKGPIAKIVADIVPDCNAKMHVTRGAIYISARNEGTGTAILIDKESGLINSPASITKEESYKVNKTVTEWTEQNGKKIKKVRNEEETKKRTLKGFKVRMLLNHRIKADAIITIQSQTAKGKFRVANGKHDGNGYVTEVEVFPV